MNGVIYVSGKDIDFCRMDSDVCSVGSNVQVDCSDSE